MVQKTGKIHLCAPSNGAVDEILFRVLKSGANKNILRVGASCYKAPEELQELDLKFKCQKHANEEMVHNLQTELNKINQSQP